MIYDLRHVTSYEYEAPVRFAHCVLRLVPVDRPGQRVLGCRMTIAPQPAGKSERTCFFGNRITEVTFEQPHSKLRCEIRSRVEVTRQAPPADAPSQQWEAVCEAIMESRALASGSPVHFVHPSRLIPLVPDVTPYAAESFPPGRPVLEGVRELMKRIRADFAYEPGTTMVTTPLAEAFAQRSGVCQDFAQIMIAGLRGLGLASAYVSGYLRTMPPPGKPRLEGADAMHAWVDVWCGDAHGWLGFDPTNDLDVARDHIVLAIGRDYADVSPVDGILLGPGDQKLDVAVDVVPVDA